MLSKGQISSTDTCNKADACLDGSSGVITCLLYQQVSFGLRVALFLDFIKKGFDKIVFNCYSRFFDAPWQRDSNENTLGLIRQYPPKDMSLSPWSQKDLDENAQLLNIRPKP
jgi:hypothetical protein